MQNPLELSIKGIKCDNPKCDYHNDNVEFREYEQWLNKPCPKCGANLLTQKDFDNTKMLIRLAEIFNNILPTPKSNEKSVFFNIEMNGTGKIDFKIKEED